MTLKSIKKIAILNMLFIFSIQIANSQNKEPFLWGTANASYQVEGYTTADGKGLSNWDVYTNKYQITKPIVGESHTGNDAIHFYDRETYLNEIKLMKQLGVNTFRFSISWARIYPKGYGEINQKGLQHYIDFVDDLLANGITPFVTLFHWDLPQALVEQGDWFNPKIVDWYENYATTIFKAFGNKVKHYITFNEPSIDNYIMSIFANNVINNKNPFAFTNNLLSHQVIAAHNLMLAHAKTVLKYKELNLGGKIGITLALIPMEPLNPNDKKDISSTNFINQFMNTWFLDASQKGTYPQEIINEVKKYEPNLKITKEDMMLIKKAKSDFLGVNYYGAAYVKYDTLSPFNANWRNNPDTIKMFNGAVRPQIFKKLLHHLKDNYNDPLIYITENGAGYGDMDEKFVNDTVRDVLRTQYLKDHIKVVLDAKKEGVNVNGYMLWSMCDNFEWISGYKSRFGAIFVDYATQKRTPKLSYYEYKKIIEQNSKK